MKKEEKMKTNNKYFSKEYSGILVIVLSVCITMLMTSPIKANTQELIGLWHFDEGSGEIAYDSSGNNNNGTLYGPIWNSPGMFGTALQFDIMDYIEVPDNPILDFEADDSFSVEAWVKTTYRDSNIMIVAKRDLADTFQKLYVLYGEHVVTPDGPILRAVFYLRQKIGTAVYCRGTTDISDGLWHHVAGVRDTSTGKVRIYVDGKPYEQQLADPTDDISNAANLWIGKQGYKDGQSWIGTIDEVRIYNGALSDDMIVNHADGYYECYIDIKPGSDPNSINLGKQGKLTVAILGSFDLDVTTIDPNTILLGGIGPVKRGKAQKLAISFDDVNDDGHTDLVAHFDVQALVEAPDSSLTENTTSLTLTAELFNGLGIIGIDSVRVVPPDKFFQSKENKSRNTKRH